MIRLALLILILALATGCPDRAGDQNAGARKVRITTAMPARQDVSLYEHTLGTVEDPRFATLSSELPAVVAEVLVDAGDPVKAGQLLLRLDDRDARARLDAAEADLQRLQALQQSQHRQVLRLRKLRPRQFVSQTQLDAAEAQLTALSESVDAARAALQQARHHLARTRIRAPFDGRVQRRFAAPGDFIGIGKPLLSVATSSRMHVTLPFPETLLGRIRAGQRVMLRLPGGDTLDTRIGEVAPAVSRRNAAFVARADLPEGSPLRPGGSVSASVELERHRDALVVPAAAVVLRPQGSVVYRIVDGRARQVPVTVGVHLDGLVEIVSGLNGDETLALDGAPYLTDGAPVDIMDGQERVAP